MWKKIMAVLVILLTLILYVLVPMVLVLLGRSSEGHLTAYDTGFDDLSEYKQALSKKGYNVRSLVSSPAIMDTLSSEDPERTVLIVAGVEKAYSTAEVDAIVQFVENGGKVIVADEGDGLATAPGGLADRFKIGFYEGNFYNTYWMTDESGKGYVNFTVVYPTLRLPTGYDPLFSDDAMRGWYEPPNRNYSVVMQRPTAIFGQISSEPGDRYNRTVIAAGAEQSYVDVNGNGLIDKEDKTSSVEFPLPVTLTIKPEGGSGLLVFISDVSMFTNDAMALPSRGMKTPALDPGKRKLGIGDQVPPMNKDFAVDLIAFCFAGVGDTFPGEGEFQVVFDESRHAQNVWWQQVFKTIELTAEVTSNAFVYIPAGICLVALIVISVLVARDRESWVHRFSIMDPVRRKNMPKNEKLQAIRLRKALIDQIRIRASMSMDEYEGLSKEERAGLCPDPDLRDFLKSEGKSYTREELKGLMERVHRMKR